MFARKPALAAAAPASAPRSGGGLLANPYLGAGGAAVIFAAAVGGLILAVGDPHAGAPSVRVAVQSPATLPTGPLRPAPSPDQLAAGTVTLDTLPPGQDVALPGDPTAAAPTGPPGEAVITLPQGGSLGGANGAAPRPVARASALPTAPIAGLTAPGPGGLLPIVSHDGRTPFQAYARPFQANGKPRIALVIGGLGLNAASTRAAIERLPPEVTLSFVPYADGLQGWIDLARADGHEVMLEIPMEPLDYPSNDPGPQTLMASAAPADTVKRLEWLLARASGYFAVTNYLGGRFMSAPNGMGAFLGALRTRGLGFIDDGSGSRRFQGGGLPRASADAVVDEQLSGEAIDRQLQALEAAALLHGQSLGAGFAYPVTLDQAARWAQGLASRGYQLAPASAVARK